MSTIPFSPGDRVVAYLRDSGHEQQELSVTQQEASIRVWCADHDLLLTQIFTDAAAPGSTVAGRQQFQAMVDHFRAPHCPDAGIIIWKYNRFARDIDDAQFFKADLRRRGYIIYSLNDPVPEGLDGRLFEAAIDWMNQRYLEDLRTDIKRGQRHVLANHGAIGGNPPRGFKSETVQIGSRRDGRPHLVQKWVPDPALWETCRLAWQMRAAGASYREIHEKIHLFSSLNSYNTFYKNPIYLGRLEFADQVLYDYCEPLVDQQTWDTVQAVSRSRTHNTGPGSAAHPRRHSSTFILSGLAFCSLCGAPLNGETVKFKAEETARGYYACSRQHNRHDCPATKIPRELLENAVISETVTYILEPRNLAAIQAEIQRGYTTERQEFIAYRAELAARLANLRHRITNLVDAIAAAGHSASLLKKLHEMENQETLQSEELARLDASLAAPPPTFTDGDLAIFSSRLTTLLRAADPQTQRRVLTGFLHSVTVSRDGALVTGTVLYYLPPDDLITGLSTPTPSGPDPPPSVIYAYVTFPSWGTLRRHKKFSHPFTFSTKKS